MQTNLTSRQQKILELIQSQETTTNKEITEKLQNTSRVTIVRDLNTLVELGLITKSGKGRSVSYKENVPTPHLQFIDPETYFDKAPDDRTDAATNANFNIFNTLLPIFTSKELEKLESITKAYQNRIKFLPKPTLTKEYERLTIEMSWKSSQIEGNTYSLIDTEILLKEQRQAKGHTKEEATMLLNHKEALNYIYDNKAKFKTIKKADILDIHKILTKDLKIQPGLRTRPVGITGTVYRPIDNKFQIIKALDHTIDLINTTEDAFTKATAAIILLSYIQPFEDGNKRTARLIGNAILLANNACPLSYRSVDEAEYKKATLLFYEQTNIRYFKELFLEQYTFATNNYFLAN